ncbi:MAG: cytochrome c-type biogenesis protein CcmH [Conexibacter sp.]
MSSRFAIACALAALLAAAPASAAPTPQTSLPQIEEQVMCVLCKTPLAVANGPQADAQRAFIRRLIARGLSEQQVKDALVAEYGERVLALPRDKGFNHAVYLVPIAAVAAALLALAFALPRWRGRTRATEALGPELSAEDARRLDEDLARYD